MQWHFVWDIAQGGILQLAHEESRLWKERKKVLKKMRELHLAGLEGRQRDTRGMQKMV